MLALSFIRLMNASALAPPLSFFITILYNLEHSEYGGVEREREAEAAACCQLPVTFLSFFLMSRRRREPPLSFSPFFLFFPSFISETVRLKIIFIFLSFFLSLGHWLVATLITFYHINNNRD